MIVGFLHPGMMGASLVGACGADTVWASEGRSPATVERARSAGARDLGSVESVLSEADTVVAICPPAAAEGLAERVASSGFDGVYVDANAISPATSRAIGQRFDRYVDGSVVGPPAWRNGTTRLYLSGDRAAEVAELWAGSVLDARAIEGGIGAASALKMAYASWTKIGGAMLLAIRALAAAEGVEDPLVAEWDLSQPGLAERSERTASGVGPKAWRFIGEMHQIADSFDATGLPTGFAEAAAEVYERLADLKGTDAPTLDEVLERM